MRSEPFFGSRLRMLEFLVVVSVCSGCAATRYTSTETLANVRPSDTLVRSFRVEHVSGSIVVGMSSLDPSASDVNRLLHARFPTVFHTREDSIPIHVECSGSVPLLGAEANDINPLEFGLFWIFRAKGTIKVSLLLDEKGNKRTVHVPFRKSRTESLLFPWPLVIPARRNWPTLYGRDETGLHSVFSELVASGVVKALNRMSAEEMAKLVAGTHKTEEQKALLRWLTENPTKTFSVKVEDGDTVFIESEHSYVPVPVDFAEVRKLPEIVSQTFDAETRRGSVKADVTGCDERLALDYLLVRFVPAICKTKGVVFDPSAAPPGGAMYDILVHERKRKDGKDIVRIEFQTIQ